MGSEELYNKCLEIAKEAHKNQKRNDKVEPYINHPIRVANALVEPKLKCVALLHDTLEDTDITEHFLKVRNIPDEIIILVSILTKQKDQDYLEYILKVSRNSEATIVKMEDLRDNLRDLHKGSLRDKYMLSLHLLVETLYNQKLTGGKNESSNMSSM